LRCDKQQPAARADQFAQKLILSPVDERRTAGIQLLIGAAAQKLNGSVHLHHTDRSQLTFEYQWCRLDFFLAFKAMTISLNKNDGCSSLTSLLAAIKCDKMLLMRISGQKNSARPQFEGSADPYKSNKDLSRWFYAAPRAV
jgi:hypothetical protein